MNIIADSAIPLTGELFSAHANLIRLPTSEITQANIKDADILIVRSITKVNADLLERTSIKCVASPVSGSDHFDKAWLRDHQINYLSSPGCNAVSVAEYVISSIAALKKRGMLNKKALTAGIIGVGHVGRKVAEYLKIIGFDVLLNDPPRAKQEPDFVSMSLNELNNVDLLCIHTPLIYDGEFPTYYLINQNLLKQLNPSTIILNAGRGAVIDETCVLKSNYNTLNLSPNNELIHSFQYCFDVWEHEPDINREILKHALIATPHIAGHCIQAKWRGIISIYQQLNKLFQLNWPVPSINYPIARPELIIDKSIRCWEDAVLKIYNPIDDDYLLRQTLLSDAGLTNSKLFDQLRQNYRIRHEYNYPLIKLETFLSDFDRYILHQLGLRL